MRHPTVRQLRVFDAIVRTGSFSRAAEDMALTQPTVSMQVKKISDGIGLPLFDHTGRTLRLTEAGEALHRLAREVIASNDRFDQTIGGLKGLSAGRLTIAAVTTAEYFLPRLLGPFCNSHPGIEVTLKVANREQALLRLKQGGDDLYVFGHPPEDVDVIARPFLENPLVVVAGRHHPLAEARRLTMADLAGHPFLVREAGSGTRSAAERAFAKAGVPFTVRMELGSNEAIKQGVMGGLGLAVVSRHVLTDPRGLVELPVLGFPILRQWYLSWPAGRPLSPAARGLYEYLKAAVATG